MSLVNLHNEEFVLEYCLSKGRCGTIYTAMRDRDVQSQHSPTHVPNMRYEDGRLAKKKRHKD